MQPSTASNRVPAWVRAFFGRLFLTAATAGTLTAQYVTVTVNSKSRPIYEAILQLQRLTTIPINYEDLQYNSIGDIQDIASQMTATQKANSPSAKVLIPRGGSFSVNVPVDPATGKLLGALSLSNALNAVIAAAQAAGAVPGTFRVDSVQPGAIFVEPSTQHSSTGSIVAAQAVLDAPVSVSFQQTARSQVLDAILQQVSQKTGFRFMDGMGTLGLWSKVSVTASSEPTKYVLARLLGDPGGGTPNSRSYLALFEPQFRYYMFNIVNNTVLQGGPVAKPYSPPPVTAKPGDPRLGAPIQK